MMILALALMAGGADAASAAPPSSSPPPIVGSWALDVLALPIPPQFRPRSVVIRFGAPSEGKSAMDVAIVDADGSTRHMSGRYDLAGTPNAITGDQGEADTGALRMPRGDVAVLNLSRAGHPASTRTYTVDDDGLGMTEVNASWDDSGQPTMRTAHFIRLPGAIAP